MTAAAPIETVAPRQAKGLDRWLAVVSHTEPRYGGLSTAVPQGEMEIAAQGHCEVSLAAFCNVGERYAPPVFPVDRISFWPTSRVAWMRSSPLRRQFAREVEAADALHIHGLWEASTVVAARVAHAQGKPYIVSAHGMLEPWALAQGRLKKQVYAALMERPIVTRAACLHALTRAEASQYRAFGAKQPIAVVPNAVSVPQQLDAEPFFQRFPELRGRRLLLYLGRLHPKKGLDLLQTAWPELSKRHPEWHLVLAGPDAAGTEGKLRSAFQQAGVLPNVTFTGMLGPELKWSAFAAAEVFVLPSYSEGLSMGVLEALGAHVPVVITTHCNLPEAVAAGAGWEIEADAASLAQALREAMRSSREENRERGRRGGYLVTSRYNSGVVAQQMAEVYNFALHGIQPRNVEIFV